MERSVDYRDLYTDHIKMPHRALSQDELHLLFDTIPVRVMDYYRAMDDESFVHLLETRKAREAALLEMAIDDPVHAQKRHEALTTAEYGTDVREAVNLAGLGPGTPELDKAEKALHEAEVKHSHVQEEQQHAEVILAYMAGQRAGLRIGVKLALMSLRNENPGEADPEGRNRLSLQMAVAMTDDAEADKLIDTLLSPEKPVA